MLGKNVGSFDRALRIGVGLALLIAFFALTRNPVNSVHFHAARIYRRSSGNSKPT